ALVDVVVDPRVVVPQDHRAVAEAEIDVLVAIGIPDEAALATIDVDRAVTPGPKVRVGAAGEVLQCAPVQRHLAISTEVGGHSRGGGLAGHEVLGCGFGRPGPWDGRCAIRDARGIHADIPSLPPSMRDSCRCGGWRAK